MKVGDLIKSTFRYKGHIMMVVQTRISSDLFGDYQQIRAISCRQGVKTQWCRASTWTVISESR